MTPDSPGGQDEEPHARPEWTTDIPGQSLKSQQRTEMGTRAVTTTTLASGYLMSGWN